MDRYQVCDECGRKFLSYAGGKPVCLTCWCQRNPDTLFDLGLDVSPGGLINAMEPVPEMTELFPAADEPVDLFPLADALLNGEVGKP